MILKYPSLKVSYSKLKYVSLSSSRKVDFFKYGRTQPASLPITIPKRTFSNFNQSHKYLLNLGKKCKISDFCVLYRSLSTSANYFSKSLGSDFHDPKKPGGEPKSNGLKNVIIFLIVFMIVNKFLSQTTKLEEDVTISWEEFKNEILAKGEVYKIVIPKSKLKDFVMVWVYPGAIVRNQKARHQVYYLLVSDSSKFEDKLRETEKQLGILPKDGVLIEYKVSDKFDMWVDLLLILLMLGVLFSSKMKNFKMPMISDMMNFKKAKFTLIDPLAGQGKGVKFSDVAGLKEAKVEIMEFVDYLKRPEYYRNLGAKLPKGALLLGPPGCGKTLLAKAVATEANVPFLSMNGSEFIEMIGGLGAARVRDLFKEAKKRIPCIVYIDEIDAIGKKRWSKEEGGSGEGEQTLNQLLVEMDGMVSNDGVLLLASTNRAEVLDSALLRPGRFDRQILIDLPTYEERREIFEQHLKSIHLEHEPSHYSKRLAHLTPGFSGANIANVCNEAALHAARHKKQIVRGEDLEYAVERVIGGTEKRSSTMTPEEKKMFAFNEAGRALVGWLSPYGEALLKVTIVPRTETPAGWTQFTQGDKFIYSKEELMGKMCMGLGGRVAVSLVFNKVTTGGEKDLKKVTRLAYAQVRQYGMNSNVGLMSFTIGQEEGALKKPYSKHLAAIFDEEARRLVITAYKETEKLLVENKEKLFKLAEELLKRETLSYNDVVQLIGPPPHSGKKLIEPFEFDLSLNQAAGPEPESQPEPEPEQERGREPETKKDE